jgi:hypothetical protein
MKPIYLLAAAASLFAMPAQAATNLVAIPGLFNTGTGAGNVALVGGNGITDPHYSIFSSTASGFAGHQAVTFKHAAYVANDADSRWISLNGTGGPGNNTTLYRLTFDLTGLIASTASISGIWGTDNIGAIFLNGVNTGVPTVSFSSLASFTLSSGFVSGLNTLDFQVQDLGPPGSLRVDSLAGTAQRASAAVPETATWAMMIVGFALVGGAMRRRKMATTVRYA